jgi:hypothetical protein
MKRYILVFAIFALCAISGAADALRTQIDARTKAIHAAVMKRDLVAYGKAIRAGVTKDFKCIQSGKTVSFDNMVASMSGIIAPATKMSSEEAILLSLVIRGDTATGTTEHKIKGISTDPEGVNHKIAFYGTSVETYRKVKGKWLLSKLTWRTRQMTVAGKPVDRPKGATSAG